MSDYGDQSAPTLVSNPNALGMGADIDLSRLVDASQAITQAVNNLNQNVAAMVSALEAA